jgi:hypothetical protein
MFFHPDSQKNNAAPCRHKLGNFVYEFDKNQFRQIVNDSHQTAKADFVFIKRITFQQTALPLVSCKIC